MPLSAFSVFLVATILIVSDVTSGANFNFKRSGDQGKPLIIFAQHALPAHMMQQQPGCYASPVQHQQMAMATHQVPVVM